MGLTIGVVGLGRIGKMHARNLAQNEQVENVVLLGRDESRLRLAGDEVRLSLALDALPEIAGRYIRGNYRARVEQKIYSSSALGELDGLVIASTTETHVEFLRQALKAGTPTLVEKPLSFETDLLKSLDREVYDSRVPVMVAFHRRYDAGYQELRRKIREQKTGKVRLIHAMSHDVNHIDNSYIPKSGGIWHDLLIHDFDTIPWLLGEAPVSVSATGSVLDHQEYAIHGDYDTASALITFESGVQALVSGARNVAAGHDVRTTVYGSDAAFEAGLDRCTPIVSTEPGVKPPQAFYNEFTERFEQAFRAEVEHFVKLIQGQAESLTLPGDGVIANILADAARLSAQSGKIIDLRESI
ncbi:Gfo/Idh/MocA family protein [Rothia nasisuis]|uniref:Gfo/Idh/MocA family protein n=1 Tax=Rothia nasisuis TaxID=2109647 RepID=UPI001F3D967B|nr:Gfo/Idh/MocA family oxidoreductase [Rothia nasisuis]